MRHIVLVACLPLMFFIGCDATKPTVSRPSTISVPSDARDRLAILAVVLRQMGEQAGGDRTCLLAVGDADFSYLDREFTRNPPGFKYARFVPPGSPKESEVVLQATVIERREDDASARGVYASGNDFVEFLYKLARDRAAWKIISKEFVRAS